MNPFIDQMDETYYTKLQPATKHDRQVWALSFRDLMQDTRGQQYFLRYLESEFSSENFKFFSSCQELDGIFSAREWVQAAYDIYQVFVASTATQQINIDATTRSALDAAFKRLKNIDQITRYEVPVSVFQDACTKVYAIMAKDSYPRFLNSVFINSTE